MKKEEIRKEFFKLRVRHHSYNQCRKILLAQFGYEISKRTLQRWNKRLNETEWDLRDKSKRPKIIHYKITQEIEKQVVLIKKQTGWGAEKIEDIIDIGHTTINKILNKHKLTKPNENRRKRIKYIRWQRDHPNSLWQMDISDQKVEGKYCFAVIDDCERYCLGLFELNNISTAIITKLLDDLIKVHGKPREILTDNGNVFGLRSKHSKFDRWCKRRGIKHIRTAIHSPTTTGKIERLFQTLAKELPFCNNDLELFRMQYNHFRPHSSLNGKCPADIYFAFYKLF
ncbi:MAG: DDE-type integrase/transposase/recombinase [Candidatus Nanoarchaeia archaeon]|nr:DDE-type integrase/transposase/recombinase [Candidatus Nanoarchaeia archaeon]MDD5741009.1 DDE-type integrase/transposase/recombinase [Candidatus Nanoarchaeia archaeon]